MKFDPVTVQEYIAFLEATSNDAPRNWDEQKDHPQWPVLGISCLDADAFAAWSHRRLPTDAEWDELQPGIAYYEVTSTQEQPGRVVRGGCWGHIGPMRLRTAYRLWYPPLDRRNDLGFRCAQAIEAQDGCSAEVA